MLGKGKQRWKNDKLAFLILCTLSYLYSLREKNRKKETLITKKE